MRNPKATDAEMVALRAAQRVFVARQRELQREAEDALTVKGAAPSP